MASSGDQYKSYMKEFKKKLLEDSVNKEVLVTNFQLLDERVFNLLKSYGKNQFEDGFRDGVLTENKRCSEVLDNACCNIS